MRAPTVWLTAVLAGTLWLSCQSAPFAPDDRRALLADWARLARAAEARETIVVAGRNGWLFFGPELRHVSAGRFWGDAAAAVSQARRPEWADPLPAILDFHARLQAAGVKLLVVPVPPKSIIYPDKLSPLAGFGQNAPRPRLDVEHQTFYDLLQENGVPVLDLVPLFLDTGSHPDGALYCRQDTHWSGHATVLAAREIAREVRAQSGLQTVRQASFEHEWRATEIAGDLWTALDDPAVAQERLPLRFVGTRAADSLVPLDPDASSPVVLLGDSHNLVFHAGGDMHAQGAGLADQLALELGIAVDLVAVRGSGATAARLNLLRRAQRDPSYWANKRLVIWCFAGREFTESDGWRIVPIT